MSSKIKYWTKEELEKIENAVKDYPPPRKKEIYEKVAVEIFNGTRQWTAIKKKMLDCDKTLKMMTSNVNVTRQQSKRWTEEEDALAIKLNAQCNHLIGKAKYEYIAIRMETREWKGIKERLAKLKKEEELNKTEVQTSRKRKAIDTSPKNKAKRMQSLDECSQNEIEEITKIDNELDQPIITNVTESNQPLENEENIICDNVELQNEETIQPELIELEPKPKKGKINENQIEKTNTTNDRDSLTTNQDHTNLEIESSNQERMENNTNTTPDKPIEVEIQIEIEKTATNVDEANETNVVIENQEIASENVEKQTESNDKQETPKIKKLLHKFIHLVGNNKEISLNRFKVKYNDERIAQINEQAKMIWKNIREKTKNENKHQLQFKKLLLACGLTLRKLVTGNAIHHPIKGKHKKMEQTLKKNEKIIEECKLEIQIRKKKIRKETLSEKEIKESKKLWQTRNRIKRMKMTPENCIQYYETRNVQIKEELAITKESHLNQKIRNKFDDQPSIKILEEGVGKGNFKLEEAEEYFTKMFQIDEKLPTTTPILDQFIEHVKNLTPIKENLQEKIQVDMEELKTTLKYTRPWKCCGPDRCPTFLYKTFGIGKEYLYEYINNTINGKRKLTESDLLATTILIPKKPNTTEIKEHRPITLMNGDLKIMTKILSNKVIEQLPEEIIPETQLANKRNVEGTLMAHTINSAIYSEKKFKKKEIHQSFIDFSKAFDSLDHGRMKKLLEALPIQRQLVNIMKKTLKMRIQIAETGKPGAKKSKKITLNKGIPQGDSSSPLKFILGISHIGFALEKNKKISIGSSKTEKGLEINNLQFMDDITLYGRNQDDLTTIEEVVRKGAEEMGLKLNIQKCASSAETSNFPRFDKYKYLGLWQRNENFDVEDENKNKETLLNKTKKIFKSRLATYQKVQLYNSTIIPAILYKYKNLPIEGRCESRIAWAEEIDKEVRKLTTTTFLKTTSTNNARLYLGQEYNCLNFKEAQIECKITAVKKIQTIKEKEMLKPIWKLYKTMWKKGYTTPISEAIFAVRNSGLEGKMRQYVDDNLEEGIEKMIEEIKLNRKNFWLKKWTSKYATTIKEKIENKELTFPYLKSKINSSTIKNGFAAAEEQLGLLGNSNQPKVCRHCKKKYETSYHILSQCEKKMDNMYIQRHDGVLHHLVNGIKSKFGMATHKWNEKITGVCENEQLKLLVNMKYPTQKTIYHNKVDLIMVIKKGEKQNKRIVMADVAISSLRNMNKQKIMKKYKYTINGEQKAQWQITQEKNPERGENLRKLLMEKERCNVEFYTFGMGTLGEVNEEAVQLLENLGITKKSQYNILEKCSSSSITASSRIIMRHKFKRN